MKSAVGDHKRSGSAIRLRISIFPLEFEPKGSGRSHILEDRLVCRVGFFEC